MIALCLVLVGAISDDAGVRQATALMDRFEYESAAALLVEAEAADRWTPPERAAILGLLGVCRAELRDRSGAAAVFERALDLDATVRLPPDTSPKIVELLEGLRLLHLKTPSPSAPEPDPPAHVSDAPASDAAAPASDVAAPAREAAPAEDVAAPGPSGVTAGVAVLATGAGIAAVSAGVWGWGLVTNQEADRQHFQDDAAATQQRSAVGQVVGQVGVLLGAAVVASAIALIALTP